MLHPPMDAVDRLAAQVAQKEAVGLCGRKRVNVKEACERHTISESRVNASCAQARAGAGAAGTPRRAWPSRLARPWTPQPWPWPRPRPSPWRASSASLAAFAAATSFALAAFAASSIFASAACRPPSSTSTATSTCVRLPSARLDLHPLAGIGTLVVYNDWMDYACAALASIRASRRCEEERRGSGKPCVRR